MELVQSVYVINIVTVLIKYINIKGLNIRCRKTSLRSTPWEIDIILNILFTCIRMKLSYTFYSRTPFKSKIGSKILFKEHLKASFYHQFSI